ncbi:MAG: MBL fold metallo-hydrolase [Candidatus Nitrosothermus koennekii]|nr:MAG: MBL fold metallo-hydrolase [Candidatus Nitrosothermus koennekii]
MIHLGDFANTISVYLIDDKKLALVDPGVYAITDEVLDAIKAKGFNPKDIDYILLTHLHIDHAGNAWALLKHMPDAKVVIHHKAIRYLVDPEPLVTSSRQVLGKIIDRWGRLEPIPEEKFIGVDDNYILDDLRFIATPGHAPFHMSIMLDDELFTGDAVGIRYKDRLRPASPLPSFRYDLALKSLEKIKELNAKRLYMPHFGISKDANNTIEENIILYKRWAEIIEEAVNNNLDEEEILDIINKEFKYDPLLADEYTRTLLLSDLRGFINYYKKKG